MGEKRLITADDLAQITHVDDPQCSPDGRHVAYVQQIPSLKDNTYHSNIWLASTTGGTPIPLTYSNKDSQPRWSPDGKTLAFVSSRSGLPQIYLLPLFDIGGEARQLTHHVNGAGSPVWSKNGTQLAFLAKMNAQERGDEGKLKQATPDDKKTFFDPLVVTRIPYRDGTTVHDNRFAQIYVMALTPDAQARRITNEDVHYTAPEWSHDGTTLYTTRIVNVGGDEYWRRANIYAIDVASGDERSLLDGLHTVYDLGLSPDGTMLAFNRRNADDTISQFEFTVMNLVSGTMVVLNNEIDAPIAPYRWTHDQTLVACAAREGRTIVYTISPDGTSSVLIDDPQHVVGMDRSRDGLIVLSASTMLNPSELKAYRDGNAISLTHANDAFLSQVEIQPATELWFESPYGRIQGWYMLPVGYEEGKQYPLALNIHGGPQFMWGSHERTLWHEWQTHAAQGYVVFYCNPRGSEGYGNKFNHALNFNWGQLALEDIEAGVDAVLKTGAVDPERMAVTGGSFGGFMTTWLIAHDQRFKAAVAQRGVYNLVSFYSTTDIPTFAQTQFNTLPWENQSYLWEHSPLAHAEKINTPLLLIHSENDFRAPIEQAEQMFAWLHRMGKTVRFVRFPREGHELTRAGEPQHRVRSLNEMVEWWNKYVK